MPVFVVIALSFLWQSGAGLTRRRIVMKTIVPAARVSLRDMKELRKEVASLKRELARLQKSVEKLSRPGKVRASKVVADSLKVVDSDKHM